MKKVTGFLLALFLIATFVLVPPFAFAQNSEKNTEAQEVSSFELFWPIVAGKTAGDPLYWLKNLKENLREALIYSKYNRADYNILLAEKRAVEFEKLITEKKDFANAKKALEASKTKRAKVLSLIQGSTAEGRDTGDLKDRFASSLDKQKKLFTAWEKKTTETEAKDLLKSFLESIDADTSALR